MSRRDCELACDEAAIRLLGEKERYAYGRTLISLIGEKREIKNLFSAATTMAEGRGSIGERIRILAKGPKTTRAMAVVVAVSAAVLVACTFTGGVEEAADTGSSDVVEKLLSNETPEGGDFLHEGDSTGQAQVPVGQGDVLALIKAEIWGNYYKLTMERRNAATGEALPVSYNHDGLVQVTSYEDARGTKLSGDGKPDQGFELSQDGSEVFAVSFWNTEQAGSIRISITQNGKSVDYLFETKDREILSSYSTSQMIKGPENSQATLHSVQVYPNAVAMVFLGTSEEGAAAFGDSHRISLTLDSAGEKGKRFWPEEQNRDGRVINVLFCFEEDIFPEAGLKDIVVMEETGDKGVSNSLDRSQSSMALYEAAQKFCQSYMEGDVKTASMYSAFSEKELSDAIPMDGSKPTELTIRWDPDLKAVYAEASYRFTAKGEDSYTYLTLELKHAYGGWRVTWKGFEK